MPRSFFVDAEADGEPKPPLPRRLVGLEATAPRVTVPIQHEPVTASFIYGDSTNLDAASFESVVTCGARRAAVFIPPSLQSAAGTLPAGPVGPAIRPADGIIRADAPLFVRRDDLNERSYNHVANADSWHAAHLVRAGSPLADRNALHNLHITFEQCTFPQGITNGGGVFERYATFDADGSQRITTRHFTPSPIRTGFDWNVTGSGGWSVFGGAFTVTPAVSPRMSLFFADDEGLLPDEKWLPPAWAWDAMSGEHTLTPFAPLAGDESEPEGLVPNAFHVFHDEPVQDVTHPITPPASADIDRYWDIGPMTDAQFAAYDAEAYPTRTADYRVAIGFQSFPQIWATTRVTDEFQRVGPRNISLEDSGMTTENHDAYSQPGHRVDYIPENAGVTITVRARIGLRTDVTKVQGFRREREKVPAEMGWLRYKRPFGRCQRILFGGTPTCDVRTKTSCLVFAFGFDKTWTKGVDCQGNAASPAFQEVSKLTTEAEALAEFEQEELDNEAYDYSWTQGVDTNGNEIPTLRRPTGDVKIHGDHECDDVACNESVFEFEIPLTGDEVTAISAGQEVTKQLLAGRVQVATEENGNPVFEDVYRTVRISVSRADTP